MTYDPPRGWVEPVVPKPGEPERNLAVFHANDRCSRINDPLTLRRVDKPYSAARCNLCAMPG
jgi:hypothetical protein